EDAHIRVVFDFVGHLCHFGVVVVGGGGLGRLVLLWWLYKVSFTNAKKFRHSLNFVKTGVFLSVEPIGHGRIFESQAVAKFLSTDAHFL
ncbi:MAG: hypothetical protein IIX37_07750, partial [Selenomonadaceae bacterium]|nr:hypothetical protein [Selenomonadaceae bacterium]